MLYAILIFTNLASLMGLIAMTKKSLSLMEKIESVNTQIEESLDIIDECYSSVSNHLKSPVLFDDPIVVMMINDVKKSRDAMLLIANKLTEPFPYEKTGSDEE